ncbi:UDP-N-acetylglucosamine 1-carboxyvinyltransferase [Gloeobacter morelensis]|uniref:UDP-N-acetylglucosamine 1-carboxyvinyltransferase n=1 Tax=Gloeobacter morelensis MG652769 TaxID=2781736 RepID=A0ABY3PQL8_9CYAN|nr:UDP-N-acetylglucosamine 1-carboxyvinyltransferase [Gloeobacter morelensis]UFP96035.1 UDP-N-acetylglucosamine 1-carboxyvinyltransferase [Gloeobacter morelensis MG652769]
MGIEPSLHQPSPAPAKLADAYLQIEGGYRLSGEVTTSGAKNSSLALMAASLLTMEPCRLHNVPKLADIRMMSAILESLGVRVRPVADNILDIDPRFLSVHRAPYELVNSLRASFFILGPILARLGMARIPLPGGCAIGARPVDLHVRGLQALGAQVRIEHGIVEARARKLRGGRIYLDYPSVGATETIMMAATLAEGETVIENAAQEPEVVDLANFCRSMGAHIRGAGSKTIVISGVPRLHGSEYHVIPDRIETGTFMAAAAITRSTLRIGPVFPEHLAAVIAKLREMGSVVNLVGPGTLEVSPGRVMAATDIETLPFPGFPTDMQAQFMSVLAVSEGTSIISETVFENRLMHVPELNRLGADIRVRSGHAIVRGVLKLSGAPVVATDLRASAALVIAGLAAHGTTTIAGLHHLDRGYESIEKKLQALGARIERHLPSAAPNEVNKIAATTGPDAAAAPV